MYSNGPPHMAGQKQDDQHEHTFSNYVRIRDIVQITCQRRWTIGKSGERGSGISVLPAWHDDDVIYTQTHTYTHTHTYIYIYIYSHAQTDCFVLSELFSVARHVGRSKPGSKPVERVRDIRASGTTWWWWWVI